jgi:hypothetical protein
MHLYSPIQYLHFILNNCISSHVIVADDTVIYHKYSSLTMTLNPKPRSISSKPCKIDYTHNNQTAMIVHRVRVSMVRVVMQSMDTFVPATRDMKGPTAHKVNLYINIFVK